NEHIRALTEELVDERDSQIRLTATGLRKDGIDVAAIEPSDFLVKGLERRPPHFEGLPFLPPTVLLDSIRRHVAEGPSQPFVKVRLLLNVFEHGPGGLNELDAALFLEKAFNGRVGRGLVRVLRVNLSTEEANEFPLRPFLLNLPRHRFKRRGD